MRHPQTPGASGNGAPTPFGTVVSAGRWVVDSRGTCPGEGCDRDCQGEGHADERLLHHEFERFKQEFRNRAQRLRLGIDLEQDAAHVVFGDDDALYLEYVAWRTRTGRKPLQVPADEPVPNPVVALWRRITRR
jgi:hypothetical protein